MRGLFNTDNDMQRYLHYLKHKAQQSLQGIRDSTFSIMNQRNDDFSHIYRHKTLFEFALLSGAVCGIEFCYAAETAFVSPILLSLGVQMRFMTLFWCIPPLVGFFVTPLIGSLSDSCRSKLGRRRPYIILLSVGIVLGLILVPNGRIIGKALGDSDHIVNATDQNIFEGNGSYATDEQNVNVEKHRPWGIVFTAVGVVLLDFCCDACQSPARTYLLDVTLPEDQARGLSVFTRLGGIGGAIGYAMGGVNWNKTHIAAFLGSQERPVFTFVSIIFLICVIITVTSFKEIPLDMIYQIEKSSSVGGYHHFLNEDIEDKPLQNEGQYSYGTAGGKRASIKMTSFDSAPCVASSQEGFEQSPTEIDEYIEKRLCSPADVKPSLKTFLKSIFSLPRSMQILCLTHLFCWMSLVCYSLYFTDFVGEVVFGGDPRLPESDPKFQRYQEGVRFGCWGMACCLLSCATYSHFIEKLVKRFGAKPVYIGGQLVYSAGMVVMAAARHKTIVILMSPSTGVMYATLFTMPYLLVAHYHQTQTFAVDNSGKRITCTEVRGMGTDVAVIGSMIFLSQFILSSCMGSVVAAVGSSVATVCASVILSSLGALCASKVLYLDL